MKKAGKLRKYLEIEKKPRKGLMGLEWVILVYTLITLLITLFCFTKLQNPDAMIWGRVRIAAITIAMWIVYRLVPCKMMKFLRIFTQMLLLGWWYADTYHINSLFPNLDHIVAHWDQLLFGCQPAMLFSEHFASPLLSELLNFAYVSYFPIILTVCAFYFFARYNQLERACFIIVASFFSFYLLFDLFPVAGPMYYYKAVGMDKIAHGIFPAIGNYFCTHDEMLPPPGWTDGIGYNLLVAIHRGEHPTGAFPSSHVGIAVVSMILAWKSHNKTLFFTLLPFALLIFFATVYIRAHYAIDVIAGLIAGIVLYLFWNVVAKKYNI